MELKERMYVRIKNKVGYCVIGKIENINDYREPSMKYCIDIQGEDFIFIPEDMIVKASYNIIDLIEVGDYVNGCKVIDFMYSKEKKRSVIVDSEIWGFDAEEIKSIVTKEQFESMSYRIGE